MSENANSPKFALYSAARCRSERPELAPIDGALVAIVDRLRDEKDGWVYSVSQAKETSIYRCFESELTPDKFPSFISDDVYIANAVDQTARLRYSRDMADERDMVREGGLDPQECLLVGCGEGIGNEIELTLVRKDGTVVLAGDSHWNVADWDCREFTLYRAIAKGEAAFDFDAMVRRYYEVEIRPKE